MKRAARHAFERIDGAFDRVFAPAWNPLKQLGALGWFFYWIVLVTGIYLYIFFDTGVVNAYESVESLTHAQWFAGGVMRSLHRYASDALVIVVAVHLVRELVYGRFRRARWFAWFTGVPLIWFVYASGISGYWLVWDTLAQYVAIATTEWLDSLPLFGEPIAANFLSDFHLTGRFFTLLVFIHIAVPLFLLLFMWIHVQRHNRPRLNPPRGLALGSLGMLVVLSLVKPALSQGPADLSTVPASVGLDWFYLFFYPLLDRISGLELWGWVGGGTLLLLLVPVLLRERTAIPPPATVDLENCNGCGRCVADCPFGAVAMRPRSDGQPFQAEAAVNASLCMRCGICVGACPTATPFRRRGSDVPLPGIDLPERSVRDHRDRILAATEELEGEGRLVVFGCDSGPEVAALAEPGVASITFPCVGAISPSFLDFLITRRHADGVLLTGCAPGNCNQRLGLQWTEERIGRTRDPHLRRRVPDERIRTVWAGAAGADRLAREIASFRDELRELGPYHRPRPAATGAVPPPVAVGEE